MNIILGGTGHVGSETAKTLLSRNEPVTIVSHSEEKKSDWEQKGARFAVADVHDTEALAEVFKTGRDLFLLNPPASPSVDTVKEEKRSLYSILEALSTSPIKKVVAESTYGAQPGDSIGDLGVLFEMEEALRDLDIPHAIIRAAYYMSNWDNFIESAKTEGIIYSMYPEEFKFPMVAPSDLGVVASGLLEGSIDKKEIYYVEGPERYSPADVAKAMSRILGKVVKVKVLQEGEWMPWLLNMGFSQAAAESMVKMTEITLNQQYEMPTNFYRGSTTLEEYLRGSILKQ
jgi:uncharacterized protein YbjT (DUF2867 family)